MHSKKTILLIINPISGRGDKTELMESLEMSLAERDYELEVCETTGDNNKDIEKIRATIEKAHPHRVLVAGGDGTIQLVADALKGTDHILGILPYGSANGFAVNLEIPGTLDEQLAVALGEEIIETDLLELNGHLCIHIADMGVNAELIKNYDNATIRGKLGYVLQSIPSLISADFPYKFHIEAKGRKYIKEGILLAIANANKFGTGANINPTGRLNDGRFELVIFKSFNLVEMVKTLAGQEELHPDFAETISTDKATIHCDAPVALQVDGEFIGEVQDVTVSLASGTVKIAVPPSFAATCEK
ncbi:MAG TPA: diacylglycerol kinase family protein [Flavipsychrobacter sp.]